MIEEKYQDLMNRAVDDALTPDEQAELDGYLNSNPEARLHFDQLRQVAGLLLQIPRTDAPDGFVSAVMNSLPDRKVEQAVPPERGLFARIGEAFRSGRGWRYTYAFSAGIACGILVLAMATYFSDSSTQITASHVSGTIGAPVAGPTELIEMRDIDISGSHGTIETRRGDGTVIVEGNLPSSHETSFGITYDSKDLVPATIWQPEPYTGIISMEPDAISLHYPTGGRFTIIFRDQSPAASIIMCRISSGGETRSLDLKTESSGR